MSPRASSQSLSRASIDRATLHAALGGDPVAVRAVVDAMSPIVEARVTRSLLARGTPREQDGRQEIADFCQEVFVALFADDARALRAWDPARGLSFPNFVGLLAQRRVATLLRKRSRVPWAETLDSEGNAEISVSASDRPSGESDVATRQLLAQLLVELESTLSPRGLDLFRRLYIDEQSVEEVCQATRLSANAVHQWRHRVGQAARDALDSLQRHADSGDRSFAGVRK